MPGAFSFETVYSTPAKCHTARHKQGTLSNPCTPPAPCSQMCIPRGKYYQQTKPGALVHYSLCRVRTKEPILKRVLDFVLLLAGLGHSIGVAAASNIGHRRQLGALQRGMGRERGNRHCASQVTVQGSGLCLS